VTLHMRHTASTRNGFFIYLAGLTMHNLGLIYSALGRHADARAIAERVLEFQRRVLPADHPDIGEGCMGRDALRAARDDCE
jgi:hypothetical protein